MAAKEIEELSNRLGRMIDTLIFNTESEDSGQSGSTGTGTDTSTNLSFVISSSTSSSESDPSGRHRSNSDHYSSEWSGSGPENSVGASWSSGDEDSICFDNISLARRENFDVTGKKIVNITKQEVSVTKKGSSDVTKPESFDYSRTWALGDATKTTPKTHERPRAKESFKRFVQKEIEKRKQQEKKKQKKHQETQEKKERQQQLESFENMFSGDDIQMMKVKVVAPRRKKKRIMKHFIEQSDSTISLDDVQKMSIQMLDFGIKQDKGVKNLRTVPEEPDKKIVKQVIDDVKRMNEFFPTTANQKIKSPSGKKPVSSAKRGLMSIMSRARQTFQFRKQKQGVFVSETSSGSTEVQPIVSICSSSSIDQSTFLRVLGNRGSF